MSNLSTCELSLLFYLFSKGSQCFDNLILSPLELSSLLSQKKRIILESLASLQKKKIIKIKYSNYQTLLDQEKPLSLSVNEKYEDWLLESVSSGIASPKEIKKKNKSNSTNLSLIKKMSSSQDKENLINVIVDFYGGVKKLTPSEKNECRNDAEKLLQKHSFDSLLFMIKHFYSQIDSLNDLLVSWTHYQEKLQTTLNKIDFIKAKKQHDKDDKELKEIVKKWLDVSVEKKLSSEEVRILEIIAENAHPRRQLFWAYRFKENYPNLKEFFLENLTRMLPVTTKGTIVKKKDP